MTEQEKIRHITLLQILLDHNNQIYNLQKLVVAYGKTLTEDEKSATTVLGHMLNLENTPQGAELAKRREGFEQSIRETIAWLRSLPESEVVQ